MIPATEAHEYGACIEGILCQIIVGTGWKDLVEVNEVRHKTIFQLPAATENLKNDVIFPAYVHTRMTFV